MPLYCARIQYMITTRMAPSPTGEYHIGHIRTLLYNYAFAKKNKGKFILRIEDTDRLRFVEGATEKILEVIKDYGFEWDEGPLIDGTHAPYVQSERLEIYKSYAEKLVASEAAYYCFCSQERLDSLRDSQRKNNQPPRYDKKCLQLSKNEITQKLHNGEKFVIRLNVPATKKIEFNDAIYGHLEFDSNQIDDQVLIKSDGFPTYHMAVVIDDYLMGVTHIMRGNDWLPSTPKHILLYGAFGWELPIYAHLPNLKEKDGSKKLSKRFGSVFARQFLEEGYLPEALVNFLMFLGWNPGTEKEIYSLSEFIEDFSLDKVHKTDLVSFDRDKLLWYNGYYIRNMPDDLLLNRLKQWSEKNGIALGIEKYEDIYVLAVLEIIKERMKLLSEFVSLTHYFFNQPKIELSLLTRFANERTAEILDAYTNLYQEVDIQSWVTQIIDEKSHELLEQNNYKPKDAFMTLRIALSGEQATPPLFDIMSLLGKKTVLERLKFAQNSL